MNYKEWKAKYLNKDTDSRVVISAIDNKIDLKKVEKNCIMKYKDIDDSLEEKLQKRSDKIWNRKLLGSEQNAMVEYLGTYYKNINDYLRGFLFETDITNYLNQTIKN